MGHATHDIRHRTVRVTETSRSPARRADGAFDPKDVTAMSMALDDVCKALNLRDDSSGREVMAVRIIELAKTGERSPTRLRDRVLHEAGMADRIGVDYTAPTKEAKGSDIA